VTVSKDIKINLLTLVVENTDGITDCSASSYAIKCEFKKLNQELSYRMVKCTITKRSTVLWIY